ncbi:MAG: peptidoglycan bridge formation glycyltransferase FemA/FemB family protein [Xanthomonadaceae bacterium]|nr:peptidoglycan bridge formation glycyltransferase FemA/FemB family protein [Xanthomonadaceae bacterium]
MWIIRPWQELTKADLKAWNSLIAMHLNEGTDVPLAQRLSWGAAMAGLGIPVHLVFDSDQNIGGLLFSIEGNLECVNGPLIHWYDKSLAHIELHEFVFHARTCIEDGGQLIIHPRWAKFDENTLYSHLIDQPEEVHYAATLCVPVQESEDLQLKHYKPRLKRSLNQNFKEKPETSVRKLTPELIPELVTALKNSARETVYLPPLPWFMALIENGTGDEVEWMWIRSQLGSQVETNLLIGYTATTAYFLFGSDQRTDTTPAWVSTARLAHHAAINEARSRGVLFYDFNGFKEDTTESDPYHRVNQFKKDWGGQVIAYSAPKFIY